VGCVVAVRNSLRKLEGIHSVEVDLELAEALVRYSPDVVDVRAMVDATSNIGFPSAVKNTSLGSQDQDTGH
jgi:mercuric ion binding protein